jgi:hypothetical protein
VQAEERETRKHLHKGQTSSSSSVGVNPPLISCTDYLRNIQAPHVLHFTPSADKTEPTFVRLLWKVSFLPLVQLNEWYFSYHALLTAQWHSG